MEDLERFGGFIRLTAHQLVSAKPTEGVCLAAQKSYKSGQIEQINLEDLERFGGFLGEADSRSVLRTEILQIEQIRQIIIFRLQISKRNI